MRLDVCVKEPSMRLGEVVGDHELEGDVEGLELGDSVGFKVG
jgi:hypothetical protein